jgi:hypothetical protein
LITNSILYFSLGSLFGAETPNDSCRVCWIGSPARRGRLVGCSQCVGVSQPCSNVNCGRLLRAESFPPSNHAPAGRHFSGYSRHVHLFVISPDMFTCLSSVFVLASNSVQNNRPDSSQHKTDLDSLTKLWRCDTRGERWGTIGACLRLTFDLTISSERKCRTDRKHCAPSTRAGFHVTHFVLRYKNLSAQKFVDGLANVGFHDANRGRCGGLKMTPSTSGPNGLSTKKEFKVHW